MRSEDGQPSVRENPQTTFTVVVADNFHYMDERELYELGTFPTLELAIAASKRVVDDYLLSTYQPGMSADQLYESYVAFGEDPFIRSSPESSNVLFSAWDYARERCDLLCAARDKS